jgi:hypothetical protein
MERRSEDVKVMQLDYTFERQIMLEREEAWKEGWEDTGLKSSDFLVNHRFEIRK